MQTAKHKNMRSQNTHVVFHCILENGPLTRYELQQKTGLSWGAVSSIISTLLTEGVIAETPDPSSRAGRRPAILDIPRDRNLIVGVDLHSQGISCVIADFRARILISRQEPVHYHTRDGFICQAIELVERAIAEKGLAADQLIGMGISVQGTVDTKRGISLRSPHLPEWNDVRIRDIFSRHFSLPVVVAHDTNMYVLSEQWHGCAGNLKDFIYIRFDMNIGMSMVTDGRIHFGADNAAGEFGHITLKPDGPLCTCGNYGCLEAYASGRTLLSKAREGVRAGRSSLTLGDGYSFGDLTLVAEAARRGGVFERSLFEDSGYYLGIGISNLVLMLNPEKIIIGGDMAHFSDLYLARTREVLRRNIWNGSRAEIGISELSSDAAAVGACLFVAQSIMSGAIEHPLSAAFHPLRLEE